MKPNPRIKKVFEKKLENLGKPLGEIMREEGYADNTADNPQIITESKSWEMLLNEYLPESLIVQTHKEAFTAEKSDKQPDWQTRTKAVELGYKVRGKLIDKLAGVVEVKGVVVLPELNDSNNS